MTDAATAASGAIPVTVLTGFLGAGKTTLLNRLLADPALADTAVVINEIGSVGLDHLLVEHATGDVVLLGAGCLCCTLRGDLVDTLLDLAERRGRGDIPAFRRVIIETTGLADPAPVLGIFGAHPDLAALYRLAGVVTVVDAVNGVSTLGRHPEAAIQVAVADRLVLGKADLADAGVLAALRQGLAALSPAAQVVDADAVGAQMLLGLEADTGAGVAAWLTAPSGPALHASRTEGTRPTWTADDGSIRTFAVTADRPLTPASLEGFLALVQARHGPDLLRMKALVALTDDPERPVVLHAVQHVLHPPRRLPAWPNSDRRSRLAFVLRGADPDEVRRLFDAFSGVPGIDQPDRQALEANPLAF